MGVGVFAGVSGRTGWSATDLTEPSLKAVSLVKSCWGVGCHRTSCLSLSSASLTGSGVEGRVRLREPGAALADRVIAATGGSEESEELEWELLDGLGDGAKRESSSFLPELVSSQSCLEFIELTEDSVSLLTVGSDSSTFPLRMDIESSTSSLIAASFSRLPGLTGS